MAAISSHTDHNGKTTYKARVRVKGHPTHTKTFTTRTAAKRWAQSLETKLREGASLAYSEAQRHTLGDAIDRYLETALEDKSARSREDYRNLLTWWRGEYGGLTLAAVTPARLSEARDALPATPKQRGGGTLTPATVKKRMAVLSHVMTMAAKEWQWIAHNPFDNIRAVRVNNARDRYLSDGELQRLLSACEISESADLHLAVLLTLTTGARKSEAMGLTWADIDFSGATVTFRHTKNGTHRAVGLVPALVAKLRERRGIGTALLFPSPKDPSRPIDLTSAWYTALKRAGIDDFKYHDLRHTAASYLGVIREQLPGLQVGDNKKVSH